MSAQFKSNASLRFVIQEDPAIYDAVRRESIDEPEKIESFFHSFVSGSSFYETQKENLVLVLFDTRLKPIGFQIVSTGGLTETSAHPRDILRPVLLSGAYGFAIIHSHPSCDPTPSRQDELFTRRIIEAADLLQLRFLDHVIVQSVKKEFGRQTYYSFREDGIIA